MGIFYGVHFQLIDFDINREISSPYTSLVMPSERVVMVVWGVLYTALTTFCLYHLNAAFKRHEKHPANQDTKRVDMFFVINNLSGIGWVLTLSGGLAGVSLVLLAFQLLMLVIIHRQLNIYQRYRRIRSNLFTQAPFSLLAAWVSLMLAGGLSEYFAFDTVEGNMAIMAVIVVATLLVIFIRHNLVFGLVMIMALYGVVLNIDPTQMENFRDINLAAWAGIWILGLASLLKMIIDLELKKPPMVVQ